MSDVEGIGRRLARIKERIASACARAGRDPAAVRLIAVTKGFPAEVVRDAISLGLGEFGENRVQEGEAKIVAVTPRPRWHLVGHLQSNKAKRAVQLFDMVQSVDSFRLGEELDRRAREAGRVLPCLIEVNTSAEATKQGVPPGETLALLERLRGLPALALEGLMTIGPLAGGATGTRASFRTLAMLRREAAEAGLLAADAHLSMGMSDDLEIGVEEGATMVRVGTALFGPRRAPTAA
jgi:hypothetical protein